MEEMRGELKTPEAIVKFILAGNATFTVRSRHTHDRFTFNLQRPKKDKRAEGDTDTRPVFARVMTGSDNVTDYSYLCTIWPQRQWLISDAKSKIPADTPAGRAIRWIVGMIATNRAPVLVQHAEFFHEGTCGRCGRKLTVPESIDSGIGPECAKKV